MAARALGRQVSAGIDGLLTMATPELLEPVTLDSLDIVDADGQHSSLFLLGDQVTIRYRMTNPNRVAVRTHVSITITRHPIVFAGSYVLLTQQQTAIWVQPGRHVLQVTATIPSDALLGRYEAVVTHTDSGDTAQLQDVFFVA